MNDLLAMAGKYTSQAILELSENETLRPIAAFLNDDGTDNMERITIENDKQAYELERKITQFSKEQRGSVLIQQGIAAVKLGDTTAIIIDIHFNGQRSKKINVIAPYRTANQDKGFATYPLAVKKATGFDSKDHESIEEAIYEGLESNKTGFDVFVDNYIYKESSLDPVGYEGTGLTSEEFDSVSRVPLIILYTMLEANNKPDEKERKKVSEIIVREYTEKNGLLMERIFEKLLDVYIDYVHSYEDDYTVELASAAKIIDDKLSTIEAKMFKKYLLGIAEEVAQASGGFLGFGNKVSAKEKATLDTISLALDMS
jgi:hypothetical protein